MDLHFAYVTSGLLCLILILLFLYYTNEKKKVQGFPFYNFLLKFALDQVTGKIPKDVPLTSYVFYTVFDILKQNTKEGLLMTYFTQPILFVFGEEEMKFFLNEKAALDKPAEYDTVKDSIGDSLLTSKTEKWKSDRKLVNPAFHVRMLKNKVENFNEHAAALVKDLEKLAGKPSVDILDALKSNYFNALSESVFGLKQSSENKEENLRWFSMVDEGCGMVARRLFHPWLRPRFLLPFSSFGRKYLKINKELKNFVTNVINDMKQKVSSNKTVDTDRFSKHLQKSFTYILLKEHLNNPSFTFQDLHAQVTTMLIGGYHTITYSTLWCLFLLALHPEIQEKAFNEIQSVIDNYITYDDCCNLIYLESVILETLRIYPVGPLFARVLSEDVQYGKYKVHKGTTIGFLTYMSHRNHDVYPEPEKFEPERFSNGEAKNASSFAPFSEGTRSCIGKKYALIEMKIFLSYILRNFKISSLDRREDIRLSWGLFLTPEGPIRMKITPRQTQE